MKPCNQYEPEVSSNLCRNCNCWPHEHAPSAVKKKKCPKCNGTQVYEDMTCFQCDGNGEVLDHARI